MARFFLEPDSWGEPAELTGEEGRHCARVLRARAGDRIEVFDGTGRRAEARIITISKSGATLELGPVLSEAPPAVEIVLAQAVLKGKAMDLLLQKAVELGVGAIQPLTTRHAVVRPGDGKEEKWRRVVLEACKQCGRSRLPEIRKVRELGDWLDDAPEGLKLVASLAPGAVPMRERLAIGVKRIVALVGPEGDFSSSEIEMAESRGFQPVRLGKHTLRSETAAIYCLAVLDHHYYKST